MKGWCYVVEDVTINFSFLFPLVLIHPSFSCLSFYCSAFYLKVNFKMWLHLSCSWSGSMAGAWNKQNWNVGYKSRTLLVVTVENVLWSCAWSNAETRLHWNEREWYQRTTLEMFEYFEWWWLEVGRNKELHLFQDAIYFIPLPFSVF